MLEVEPEKVDVKPVLRYHLPFATDVTLKPTFVLCQWTGMGIEENIRYTSGLWLLRTYFRTYF